MAKTDPFSVAASQILCKLYCRPALGQFSNYNCRRALREQFLTASFAELCELLSGRITNIAAGDMVIKRMDIRPNIQLDLLNKGQTLFFYFLDALKASC